MRVKFQILEGHKKDTWFIQAKSAKIFEIVDVFYNELKAKEELSFRIKTAHK